MVTRCDFHTQLSNVDSADKHCICQSALHIAPTDSINTHIHAGLIEDVSVCTAFSIASADCSLTLKALHHMLHVVNYSKICRDPTSQQPSSGHISLVSALVLNTLIVKLAVNSGKRNVTIWRPSVQCPIFFSNHNTAHRTNST